MRITDLLDARSINLNASCTSKEDALNQAIELMVKSGKIDNVDEYRAQVFAREEEGTTGSGEGIAVPHGKCSAVKKPGLAAMVIKNGVEFNSLDGEPVTLLFLIAAPDTGDNVHVDVLSKLSMLMMDEKFADKLRRAKSVDEFRSIIDIADVQTKSVDEKFSVGGNKPSILAVTSCPTGIAHTYMAAEGIEKAARKAGASVKVETRGSGGAKNVLTAEEIANATCIIVAADAQVPMDRFDGKRVIECAVSEGINKGEQLVDRALHGNVPVYHAKNGNAAVQKSSNGSVAHQIYTQLMNGVSHMLPFVVGGGILIAIAFLIDGLGIDLNSLSAADRGNFGTITPAAALFKSIGGTAFGFMLPILAGYIAMAIGDRPALALGFIGGSIAANGKSGFLGAIVAGFLAGYIIKMLRKLCDRLPAAIEKIAPVLIYPLVGIFTTGVVMMYVVEPIMGFVNTALNSGLTSMGDSSKLLLGFVLAAMMAIDMGGPFNKAAYVFGVGAIAAGSYDIMASVMVGGMVPPCAIALATILFKNKFTKEERESGPTNFIMGLAFITEGAIPYAAADPFKVLPACMISSGIAGLLSMLFKCTLMAPHGGIFVFPVVGNALLYLLALVIGTVVGAILLGAFKKRVEE